MSRRRDGSVVEVAVRGVDQRDLVLAAGVADLVEPRQPSRLIGQGVQRHGEAGLQCPRLGRGEVTLDVAHAPVNPLLVR
jgi:hypothetical protein